MPPTGWMPYPGHAPDAEPDVAQLVLQQLAPDWKGADSLGICRLAVHRAEPAHAQHAGYCCGHPCYRSSPPLPRVLPSHGASLTAPSSGRRAALELGSGLYGTYLPDTTPATLANRYRHLEGGATMTYHQSGVVRSGRICRSFPDTGCWPMCSR